MITLISHDLLWTDSKLIWSRYCLFLLRGKPKPRMMITMALPMIMMFWVLLMTFGCGSRLEGPIGNQWRLFGHSPPTTAAVPSHGNMILLMISEVMIFISLVKMSSMSFLLKAITDPKPPWVWWRLTLCHMILILIFLLISELLLMMILILPVLTIYLDCGLFFIITAILRHYLV